MKNARNTTYIPANLEIITFECSDIITTSGVNAPESDDGEIRDW